jgi:hypothetical protein
MSTEDSMRAAAKTGCIAPLRFDLPPLPYAYDALQPVISHTSASATRASSSSSCGFSRARPG